MSVNNGSNVSTNRRESANEAVKEIDQLRHSIHHCRELASRIKSSELSLSTDETAYKTELGGCRKKLTDLRKDLDPELQLEAEELEAGLKYVERIRPVTRIPLLLKLSLGEACFVLPDTRQRLKYKTEYENFKLQATIVHLVLSLLQLVLIKGKLNITHYHHFTLQRITGMHVKSTLLDMMTNFLLLYAYSTITVREHILLVNGSNIRAWWIIHHILCIFLSGTLLIWPASQAYHASRTLLITFSIYIAAVQAMQYRYQMSRLYVLRSLSKVGPMDTTTESAQVHVKNNLAFLMPFLILGFVHTHIINSSFYWVGISVL